MGAWLLREHGPKWSNARLRSALAGFRQALLVRQSEGNKTISIRTMGRIGEACLLSLQLGTGKLKFAGEAVGGDLATKMVLSTIISQELAMFVSVIAEPQCPFLCFCRSSAPPRPTARLMPLRSTIFWKSRFRCAEQICRRSAGTQS